MKQERYTIYNFRRDFPDEASCLRWLMDSQYPDGVICKKCQEVTPHHQMKTRKSFSCEICGHHVHPMAGTIFEGSTTPLTLWFHAIYIMGATRAGISAKQLEREIGVTYKTAWRMFHKIRSMMSAEDSELKDEVEVDEMYIGAQSNKRTTAQAGNNAMVFGMVERGGRAKVKHLPKGGKALLTEIKNDVDNDATIYSDSYPAYKSLYWMGYKHRRVHHYGGEYVNGVIHTQNVENLWSNMKRGIKGVYRHVDPKYLQNYAQEYAFRYSHRNTVKPMFWLILEQVTKN